MEDGLFDTPSPPSPPAPGTVSSRPDPIPPLPGARPGAGSEAGALPPGEAARAVDRHCARPTCSRRASATMTYDYGNRTAWVDALSVAPLPQGYDLCADHADRLGVPQGWTSTDRRPAYLPDRLAG